MELYATDSHIKPFLPIIKDRVQLNREDIEKISVADPFHLDIDPDPQIRFVK